MSTNGHEGTVRPGTTNENFDTANAPAEPVQDTATPGRGETLTEAEVWWRDRQVWLAERGYMLRPRYRPGWKPSWKGTTKRSWQVEDGIPPKSPYVLDATRTSDQKLVMLKQISKELHPFEVEIGQFFSTEPRSSDSRNHCVPILEVLQDPIDEDYQIIVMPLLRLQNSPPFETVGEILELFKQMFEGLHFMHEHRVAHRDVMILNVMMDPEPLFPDMYHPIKYNRTRDLRGKAKHRSRTERPTRYYLTDFGLSRKYTAEDPSPREYPIIGGDPTVPEFQGDKELEPSNPFPTDVYYAGNLIREEYLNLYLRLEFMNNLVEDMTQVDPTRRPAMTDVVSRFQEIISGLSPMLLRSRLPSREENMVTRLLYDVKHAIFTAGYILRRVPAVPRP